VFGGLDVGQPQGQVLTCSRAPTGLLFYPSVRGTGGRRPTSSTPAPPPTSRSCPPSLPEGRSPGQVYLVGSDYVIPHGQQDHQPYAEAQRHGGRRQGLPAAGRDDTATPGVEVIDAEPDVVFTPSNGYTNGGLLQGRSPPRRHRPTTSPSCPVSVAERRSRASGREHLGHLDGLELLPDHREPRERGLRGGFKEATATTGLNRRTQSRPSTRVYICLAAGGREGRQLHVERLREAAKGPSARHPRGSPRTVSDWNQHVAKTAASGRSTPRA
jgi:hypothetical protein